MDNMQPNKKEITSRWKNPKIWRAILIAAFALALLSSAVFAVIGISSLVGDVDPDAYERDIDTRFLRVTTAEEEDYSEKENTLCPVEYVSEDGERVFTVLYTLEEWEEIGEETVFRSQDYYVLRERDGERTVAFTSSPSREQIVSAVRDVFADETGDVFSLSITFLIFAASVAVILFFGKHFTLYEKCWFLGIMVMATIFAVLMPEESCNGVSGIWIMLLYLADTFLNILCELLISKQSKWNFIVSVFVEIVEILICVVLAYRFATMATTLFFWLPCDIISFINWHKKPDKEEQELTRVRTLKGWQEVLVLFGIVVWTLGVGYLMTRIDLQTELFGGNETLKNIVCYLDACVSLVAILNGLAILFRFREQWVCWFIDAILEGIINILSGQFVLLPLKLGYMTNCVYGYIKWTKYIDKHPEVLKEKSFL